MAENFISDQDCGFKDAVCIDTARIYDSCSDKDCLENLRVVFPEAIARSVIDVATSAKIKNVTVLNVLIDVEPLPFNKGFFSVSMTYYFEVTAEVCTPQSDSITVVGFATAEKRAILFGSDGGARVFKSGQSGQINQNSDMPTAKVQVVDPICLNSELVVCTCPDFPVKVPDCIASYFKCCCFGRNPDCNDNAAVHKDLYVTLGLFSIVLLERRVQMISPCYDFCVPDKDCSACVSSEQNPCELFSQISFPTDKFFPPKLNDCDCSCGC